MYGGWEVKVARREETPGLRGELQRYKWSLRAFPGLNRCIQGAKQEKSGFCRYTSPTPSERKWY
jgi:hypothetical protein